MCELLLDAGIGPIVAPSANLAGNKPPRTGDEVLADLDGKIDLLIDAGQTKLGTASTIVKFAPEGGYEILRDGVYEHQTIERMMRKQILFVCSGNTCRSPMAEGLAKAEIARRLGCEVDQIAGRGFSVISAGSMSFGGSPATLEAVTVAKEMGAQIGDHSSQSITAELINESDLVFCMARHHGEAVLALSPQAGERMEPLDSQGEITDPIGGGVAVYRQTAEQILQAIRRRLDTIIR